MTNPVFLKRVVLNNYKSIKECSVPLGPLTFLVEQSGAGKSNFLDALRFVTESLNTSLEHTFRERGGINEVRRRFSGNPTHFGIRLEWKLPDGTEGIYAFRVGAQIRGGFEVQKEECRIFREVFLSLRDQKRCLGRNEKNRDARNWLGVRFTIRQIPQRLSVRLMKAIEGP